MPDLKTELQQKLAAFQRLELRPAALGLLGTLGYRSEKTVDFGGVPDVFMEQFGGKDAFRKDKALFDDWREIHLLFQLTEQELGGERSLFAETDVKQGLMTSYLFFAVKLKGESYPRGKLAQIARQLNRLFPMPVMVLFEYDRKLSIAVINRRRSRRDESHDVLGKVTLIQEISLQNPHRGHLDILASFAVPELKTKKAIDSFDALHAAWEEVFNVELLNKRFYRKIQEWFFWAVQEVRFPHGGIDDTEQRNRIAMIRLLTRVIFCWFAREKGLLPEKLFESGEARRLLGGFDPSAKNDGGYYRAFLQNLFFAVLSIPSEERRLRDRREYHGRQNHYMNHARLRYRELFADAQTPEKLFADIPFLNGGLFECLDYRNDEDGKNAEMRVDGFSDSTVEEKRAFVPNVLFFGKAQKADLHEAFNDDRKSEVEVDGLFTILDAFKFTVTENTPIEEEIALDPELLGRIFENLLAEYNPETEKTARKETGSFYTRRTIVDGMVNKSLKAYLKKALASLMSEADAQAGLDILFAYTEKDHPFNDAEKLVLLDAIYDLKILDLACGSGAFPMGMLQKLVYVLEKLDHGHDHWKQRILKDTPAPMKEETRKLLEREKDTTFKWKLGLVQRCIYGIDIQPIAVQIAKLRCFVSLLVDFKVDPAEQNSGVPALPNLDFKFVAADSLIKPPSGIERDGELGFTDPFFDAFAALAEDYFFVRDPVEKKKLRGQIEKLVDKKIGERESAVKEKREALEESKKKRARGAKAQKQQAVAQKKDASKIERIDREVELWESYRNLFAFRNAPVGFFDPRYFFPEIKTGFDLVVGNPPYVQIQKFPADKKAQWEAQNFLSYAATADIYCLFYERGAQLLKKGGHLCYITSNKWMRADYGEPLRKFLSEKVDTSFVLDFGMAQNFGAATTYTCILGLENSTPRKTTRCCYAADAKAAMDDPETYFNQNAVPMPELSDASWVVCSPERYKIKQAVEAQGIPLEKWDIKINYGIKTGLNDAFYLTQEQRDELIAKEPQAEEIIVPLLRGRYVERYKTNWDQTWMIGTFPTLGIKLAGYPQIKKHLQQFRVKLEPKPTGWKPKGKEKWEGRKMGSYQWFETQDSIGYHEEFRKPKIIYPNMTKYLPFYYDESDHFFGNQKCFIITSETESLPYLTAVFNSSLFRCCFRDNFPELLGNTYELSKVFFDKIPTKKPTEGEAALFEKLVAMVQFAKRENLDVPAAFLEELIDACVLELYFPDEALKKDLQFITDTAVCLEKTIGLESEKSIREFIGHCTARGLGEKLNRLSACDAAQAGLETASLSACDAQAGPGIFAVIKREGKV